MTTQPISPLSLVPPGVPSFEGIDVESAVMKMTGTVTIEADSDTVVSIDDRVRVIAVARVVGVTFKLNPADGKVIREQVLKVIEMGLCPFDPADPNDTGIVKARPGWSQP